MGNIKSIIFFLILVHGCVLIALVVGIVKTIVGRDELNLLDACEASLGKVSLALVVNQVTYSSVWILPLNQGKVAKGLDLRTYDAVKLDSLNPSALTASD